MFVMIENEYRSAVRKREEEKEEREKEREEDLFRKSGQVYLTNYFRCT